MGDRKDAVELVGEYDTTLLVDMVDSRDRSAHLHEKVTRRVLLHTINSKACKFEHVFSKPAISCTSTTGLNGGLCAALSFLFPLRSHCFRPTFLRFFILIGMEYRELAAELASSAKAADSAACDLEEAVASLVRSVDRCTSIIVTSFAEMRAGLTALPIAFRDSIKFRTLWLQKQARPRISLRL